MRRKKISVIGAGPVGTAIALALQDLGFSVTIIAEKLPGEGLTGDLAAGLGCFFKLSPPKMASFVIESYTDWMSLAADAEYPAVAKTFLQTVSDQSDPPWASKVSGFVRPDNAHINYITYAFDPQKLGQWRLDHFKRCGGSLQHRALSADEVVILRDKAALPGFDYTVITMGLDLRSMRPELGLYAVRGVLVHLPAINNDLSFLDEDACSYIVSRPNGLIVGGSVDRYVETISANELVSIGQRIVVDANRRFGFHLDFEARMRITVGYRPMRGDDLILEFDDKVAFVNGLRGEGWAASPALSRFVARSVEDHL